MSASPSKLSFYLPKDFIYSKTRHEMSPFPAFSVSLLVFQHLSSPSLSILISITLPPLISSPCRIYPVLCYPFHICSFSLFRFFPLCSQCVAAAVQPCQDQVVLKSWQRQRCLTSLADIQLEAVKLGFKQPPLPPQRKDGGTDERRDAGNRGERVRKEGMFTR